MSHWLTVHYPHPQPDTIPWHVYLKSKFKDIADQLLPGDRVAFYELKTPRPLANGTKPPPGDEGIVVIATVSGPSQKRPLDIATEDYADGTRVTWLWGVPTRDLDKSGYVPRGEVCEVLNFSENSRLRGIGIRSSGVKELTERQFNDLVRSFRQGHRPRSRP